MALNSEKMNPDGVCARTMLVERPQPAVYKVRHTLLQITGNHRIRLISRGGIPMQRIATLSIITFATIALIAGAHLTAEQGAGHNHIGHVMDAWNDTPDGVGLLPAAVEEAGIAAQHASLAAKDPSNLDSMKRHTAHVLHAVDPTQIENGPGKGYGVKQGAEGAAKHIQAAANTDGASDAIKTHATHVATSARNTVARADEIVALAKKIAMATSASTASSLVAELNTLAQQLLPGTDANGDGRTGWQEGEGGLEVATTHANIMKKAEGLP